MLNSGLQSRNKIIIKIIATPHADLTAQGVACFLCDPEIWRILHALIDFSGFVWYNYLYVFQFDYYGIAMGVVDADK